MSIVNTVVDFVSNNVLLTLVALFVLFSLVKRRGGGEMEEFPGHRVQAVKDTETWQQVTAEAAKDKKLLVVDFYATWCGPCRYASPVFGKMSTEFPGVNFAKVDVDQCGSISHDNNVRAMPTFILFKNGRKVEQVTGWSESKIRNLIEKHK